VKQTAESKQRNRFVQILSEVWSIPCQAMDTMVTFGAISYDKRHHNDSDYSEII